RGGGARDGRDGDRRTRQYLGRYYRWPPAPPYRSTDNPPCRRRLPQDHGLGLTICRACRTAAGTVRSHRDFQGEVLAVRGYVTGILAIYLINVIVAYAVFLPAASGTINLGISGFMAIGAYFS